MSNCPHANREPVESSGEIVAQLCLDCDSQLAAGFLSADELLNCALLAILRRTVDTRYEIDIRPELPPPQSYKARSHLEACSEVAIDDVASKEGSCGNDTCNVAIINMTVRCPHVAAAPAQLDTYGHLLFLLDEMHRIGQDAAWGDDLDEGEGNE